MDTASFFSRFLNKFSSKKAKFFLVILVIFLITGLFLSLMKPSNDRVWTEDQSVLAYAEINKNLVTIFNIRNFSYTTTEDYIKDYYDKTFDLNKIKKVWYIVEPFSGIPGSAHTFLSFEFEDEEFVSVSVEIRKEKGESFHPIKGLFNQYELMYVIADERDVVKLRSNYRKDPTYIYPAVATTEKARELFLDIIKRVNSLKERPEFYNTVTNTCTTNIAKHINNITPKKVPFFSFRILFPANSDKLAYDLKMLDTNLSFEEARARFYINDRAEKYVDSPDFSIKIREIES